MGAPPEKFLSWLSAGQPRKEPRVLFHDTERTALAWAETVIRVAETGVPDETYRAALAVFGEKELVDLTIAISLSFRNHPPQAASKN